MTKHAVERALERRVELQHIEFVINNPHETIYDIVRENYKSCGLISNSPFNEQPWLLVVHSKFNTAVLIITVMWIDKGGLRAYGFGKF
ncbi:MAG: DUF4258 domain-containing protein [Thermoproteota archaeon]